MRGGICFTAGAVALLGLVSIGASTVNPNGQYSCSGKYTWKQGSELNQGTHSGSMTLNNLKFFGTTIADDGGQARNAFTLNRKPSSTTESVRTVTGTVTATDDDGVDAYEVFQGSLTFKITLTNRIKYAGTVKSRCISGDDTGAVLAMTFKGAK